MESEYNMVSTLVFLGPSLPHKKAQAILPEACILPPAQSGDILRALRLKPKIIVLIDGYFENTAAVWHKELLYAIEQKIVIIAGGSMGALRASELSTFGVIPMGKIVQAYLDNTFQDDDEVAILHGHKQSAYLPLTDAMVNIRATLQLAYQQQVINESSRRTIEKIAKQLYYPERTLRQAIKLAAQYDVDEQQISELEKWLKKPGSYQDVKCQDAIFILSTVAQATFSQAMPEISVNRTAFFRALQKNIQCRPFSSYQPWLPIQEKTALAARYLGATYRLIRRLAYLLAACYSLAKERRLSPTAIDENNIIDEFKLAHIVAHSDYDWALNEKEEFTQRISMVISLFKQEQSLTDIPGTYQDYLLLLMRLSGDYALIKSSLTTMGNEQDEITILHEFKANQPRKYQLLFYLAYCWWSIERSALRLGLQPNDDILQHDSDNFRRYHKLHTEEIFLQWLANNDIDLNGYYYLIAANFRLRFLVFENNLDMINETFEDNQCWWLLDALWLSDYYSEAKMILTQPLRLEQLKQQAHHQSIDLDEYAYSLDFIGGNQEFFNEKFDFDSEGRP